MFALVEDSRFLSVWLVLCFVLQHILRMDVCFFFYVGNSFCCSEAISRVSLDRVRKQGRTRISRSSGMFRIHQICSDRTKLDSAWTGSQARPISSTWTHDRAASSSA